MPQENRERPKKNYSEFRDSNRRPDNNRNLPRNQGNYKDSNYGDGYQNNQQQRHYNKNFNRDFPELSSDHYSPRDNRNYGNNERSRDNRQDYDHRHDYYQHQRGYDNDYQRSGDYPPPRGRGGPGLRRGGPVGSDRGGRGGSRGRGGPSRGGRGGVGPKLHESQRPLDDHPRPELAPHKGK